MIHPPQNHPKRPGFALIATVTLLILLALIAMGFLSLSAVTLRSSSQEQAVLEAQANARMALQIAIGELQKQMGPDQRISANGAILSQSHMSHPHWLGVWDSWVAGAPSEAPVNPEYPGVASHHQTIGFQADDSMRPEYDSKDRYFRSWLLSLSPGEASDMQTPIGLGLDAKSAPVADTNAVYLVAQGSLGDDAQESQYVAARLIAIDKENRVGGRYAWWVGDESQKARIMQDAYDEGSGSLTDADRIHRSMSPGSLGNKMLPWLEGMTDESQLAHLPSRMSLDLLDVDPKPTSEEPTIAQRNFHASTLHSYGVMSDVREGGLKRDLSTILEREIDLADEADEFMLYRFDDEGEDRVPIQDLAAYYQLYRNDPSWASGGREGIAHNGSANSPMQVNVPNHGNSSNLERYLRQYTSLYQNPVPIKVQFVIAAGASAITQAERDFVNDRQLAGGRPLLRDDDIYKLSMGIMPVVTLWNPNNVPMVIGTDASLQMKVNCPPFALQWKKYRSAGDYISVFTNLNYAIGIESTHSDARARSLDPFLIKLQFARNQPIVFAPGEVRMFSIPIADANKLENDGAVLIGNQNLYQAEPYFPDGFYVAAKTAPPRDNEVVFFTSSNNQGVKMVFGAGDKISLAVYPEQLGSRALTPSTANEVIGGAFNFWLADTDYVGSYDHYRNYQMISRFGGSGVPTNPIVTFNRELMLPGFPNRAPIDFDGETNAIPGTEIVASTSNGEAKGMLLFSMMAGCETNLISNGGVGSGRRISSRPFLHGCTLAAPQMADSSQAALYDYGWEWQVDKINEVEEAFQDDGESRGYYGGGYTVEAGTTRVVQQYLPVLPPLSIASLSSAHLGGYSLARNAVVGANPDQPMNRYVFPPGNTNYLFAGAPLAGDFRQVTATGQGGLLPRMQQAVGNSYAHPNLPPDKAFKSIVQLLNEDLGSAEQERAYGDHSYLVNKALWDEFFFSSITPQPGTIPLYGSSPGRTASEVVESFLFEEEPLPNRRFLPHVSHLSPSEFENLKDQYDQYQDGFADKIAAYMMVSGPFNINSTSVEAWKALFSSLKGKPLTYLDELASELASQTVDDTAVAPGMLPNGDPIDGASLGADPNMPEEQWTSSRTISDEEIEQLAQAMVRQVKQRGPFLSLSEFINRRLENLPGELDGALKGALQAALDDPSVSINAAFRNQQRITDLELGSMSSDFTEAFKGPVAYGSTPYIDQADVLRHMGSILTPRGDTFVIRTYGDSLDAQGNVAARAWCEAVVQRIPEYVDTSDEPHLKAATISSINRQYGRQFQIISFRWLHGDEV